MLYEHDGKRLSLAAWSDATGMPARTLYARIHISRWTIARALTEPVAKRRRGGGRPARGVPRACPRLKRHASGRAYVRWKANGSTHERYFGAWASEAAAAGYRLFGAQWARGEYVSATTPRAAGLSVAELALAWIESVRSEYRKDGRQTSYVQQCECAVRPLATIDPIPFAAEFAPAHLRAIRETWVAARFARSTCNLYTARLVAMFRWGVSHSLVSASVWHALQAVEALKAGRTAARDPAPRRPVLDDHITATLPHLAPTKPEQAAKFAAMIQIQRLAGMRPGEICKLRPCDLDSNGDVWRYVVDKPKNAHRGRKQVYYLGPRAVVILAPHLANVAPDAKVFPFVPNNYSSAVLGAARRAGVPHWTPHQLRHALATAVAEQFRSLSHAAAAIGDSEAVAQAVYVHIDPRERAKIEVARAMG